MKKLAIASIALLASSPSAFAADCFGMFGQIPCPASTAVPEISALQGTAAIAAVAAVMLLAWERRRRNA